MANETPLGREVLNIPFGEIIREVANGIAEAQFDLDKTSMLVAELMSGQQVLRDPTTGLPLLKDGEAQLIDSTVQFGHRYEPIGSGAKFRAVIGKGELKGIVMSSLGSQYADDEEVEVIIAEPTGAEKTRAEAKAVIENGQIVRIEVTKPGQGYLQTPSVRIAAPANLSGQQASATAVLAAEVIGFEVVDGGSGYDGENLPQVVISGAGGTGATATANIATDGTISSLSVGTGGKLYESAPTVEIVSPVKAQAERLSMMELGFVPNFYQFVDTVIDMRLALRVNKTKNNRTRITAATVDASYASSYNYQLAMASRVKTKIVPIPPPTMLEERLRQLMADRRAQTTIINQKEEEAED